MNRLITAFILLLVSGSALAADTAGTLAQTHQFASTLAPPETDYSVAYLSQIFGTVGNVLQGTSGQVLGHMFDIFNKGVLVVAAIYLGMTTLMMTLHASHQGSFMTQKYNVATVLLRVAFGFALLIPSSATGYSLLQDLFMKVVVEGVGLADQTWDAALKYIKYGGQLYIPPASLSNDTDIISATVGSNGKPGPIAQIFADEVCMVKSSNWEKQQATNPLPYYAPFHPVFTNAATGVIYFPGWLASQNQADWGKDRYSFSGTEGNATTNAACGFAGDKFFATYKPTGTTALPSTYTPGQTQALQEYSYEALKQLVISLLPAAKSYANNSGDDDTTSLTAQNNMKTVFTGILAYMNLITPYQNVIAQSVGTDAGLLSKARGEGWIMAGGMYWQVEETNNDSTKISMSSLLPIAPAPSTSGANAQNAKTVTDTVNTAMSYESATNGLSTLWGNYVGAQQNTISAYGGTGSDAGGLAGSIGSSALANVTSSAYALGSGSNYNPIAALMDLGNKLLITVGVIWYYSITISVGISIYAGVCMSTQPGNAILEAALTWVKSIIMAITTMLIVPGAILSYYVPLYPFAVFTFAAVGWLLMVIEGMAAAPLIAVGVTHPEGHDFLGKSEQALMLFLSIFLRPTLMIIGLVAAMVVSFVAFHLFVSGFGNVIGSLEDGSRSALSDDFLIIVSICLVLIIFGMMTMELIEQCYKLIFTLPQYILRWIGGPSDLGGEYGQMAAGIKSGVGSSAQQGSQSLNSAYNAADATFQKQADVNTKAGKSSIRGKDKGGSNIKT